MIKKRSFQSIESMYVPVIWFQYQKLFNFKMKDFKSDKYISDKNKFSKYTITKYYIVE